MPIEIWKVVRIRLVSSSFRSERPYTDRLFASPEYAQSRSAVGMELPSPTGEPLWEYCAEYREVCFQVGRRLTHLCHRNWCIFVWQPRSLNGSRFCYNILIFIHRQQSKTPFTVVQTFRYPANYVGRKDNACTDLLRLNVCCRYLNTVRTGA